MNTTAFPMFWRIAAACSLLSVFTTLTLIFAGQFFAPVVEGLAGRMQRVEDPVYQFRAWVYLLHPFIVFTAGAAMAVALWRKAPVLAGVALAGFALWAMTEAGQQTLTLFAFDDWRRAWLAGDPSVRATMDLRAALYDGLWDAAYTLLLIGFVIGNSALAAILLRQSDWISRVIAILMIAAVVLSAVYFAQEIWGPLLPSFVTGVAYPAIQPLGRTLIAIWLWRHATRLATTARITQAGR